ncbi:hypothetical protein [Mucilaginibacter sp.]|uniref:hypothetical protein n=1 Tax=Mucilaginibacter sp. TaxID=1882438 RepID=UPI002619C542|nr:hypothetical protein [Mucilaginibacter sp.]MDB4922089.1 putative transport system permease protein [Mucilaginibacter sp.]
MNTADRVWDLATKKLMNEASEEDLKELDLLLLENLHLKTTIMPLCDWWEDEPANHQQLLALKSIKPVDEDTRQNTINVQSHPLPDYMNTKKSIYKITL